MKKNGIRLLRASCKVAAWAFRHSDFRPQKNLPVLLVAGHKLNFVQPLITYLRQSGTANVVVQEWEGASMGRVDRMLARLYLQEADVVLCEWCLDNAVWFSRILRPGQRLFVRLHAMELRFGFLARINWQNIEKLIAICPENLRVLRQRFPGQVDKICLLHNLFDTKKFLQPKKPDARFCVGMIGMVPWIKRPDLAVELITELRRLDPRYRLKIVSKDPRELAWISRRPHEVANYQKFFRIIESPENRDAIAYEGESGDVADWLRGIGFVISTSDSEGSHQAVAEGMASGCVPAVLAWPGASEYYPAAYVRKTVQALATEVIHVHSEASWQAESRSCINWASRFDLDLLGREYAKTLGLV